MLDSLQWKRDVVFHIGPIAHPALRQVHRRKSSHGHSLSSKRKLPFGSPEIEKDLLRTQASWASGQVILSGLHSCCILNNMPSSSSNVETGACSFAARQRELQARSPQGPAAPQSWQKGLAKLAQKFLVRMRAVAEELLYANRCQSEGICRSATQVKINQLVLAFRPQSICADQIAYAIPCGEG